jgi:phenylacetate-CoA ligase
MRITASMISGYHALPPWAWSLAATVRGYQLRKWRYGVATDEMVRAAREREYWDEVAWEQWRRPRLESLLRRAVERVPFYRDYWASQKGKEWRALGNWPVLEKESVRANPLAFVADDCDPRAMFPEHTSGSTGSPVRLGGASGTE